MCFCGTWKWNRFQQHPSCPGKLFSGGAKRQILQRGETNPELCRRQGGGNHARADLAARPGRGGGARVLDKNHPFAGFWYFACHGLCPRWSGEQQLLSYYLRPNDYKQLQTANVVIKKMSMPPLVLLVHR